MKKKHLISGLAIILSVIIVLIVIIVKSDFIVGGKVIKVEANPNKGFYYEYFLFIPNGMDLEEIHTLIVEPNNTGKVSDNHNQHVKSSYNRIRFDQPNRIGQGLKLPVLMPCFDRLETDGTEYGMYTHALDRDTLLETQEKLARIDLQLIAMIDDARTQLTQRGITIEDKIFMNGFSASATFVNRFTSLHPQMVAAVAAGGLNGMVILPTYEYESQILIYPIGVSDIQKLAEVDFNAEQFSSIPQYYYMGENDTNDTLYYDECFSPQEREVILATLGDDMKQRWIICENIYSQNNINAQFVVYPNTGHETNDDIDKDIIEFFSTVRKS